MHKQIQKARKKQHKYNKEHLQDIDLKVGDAVYFRNHKRSGKLDKKWNAFYRIIKQNSPVTFVIKNQLNGTSTTSHASHLRKANVDEWQIPSTNETHTTRKSTLAAPIESSDADAESSDSDNLPPLHKIAKHYRQERSNSSNESDIPLAELAKRLNYNKNQELSESCNPENKSERAVDNQMTIDDSSDDLSGVDMSIAALRTIQNKRRKKTNRQKKAITAEVMLKAIVGLF